MEYKIKKMLEKKNKDFIETVQELFQKKFRNALKFFFERISLK